MKTKTLVLWEPRNGDVTLMEKDNVEHAAIALDAFYNERIRGMAISWPDMTVLMTSQPGERMDTT